jgi:hypothetical protein
MLKRTVLFLVLVLALALFGCSSDSSAPETPEQPYEPTSPVNPQPSGGRLFGITVSESSNGFLADFDVARQAGIEVAELSLNWDDVEVADGVYQDPNGVLEAMTFYEANAISLMLTFAVINTVEQTTPDHLDAYDWNAPELIASFNNMADWVFSQLPPDLNVVGVSVGNEVNFVLVDDQWTQYGEFFQAASTHLHTIDADLEVGVKCTVYEGLFGITGSKIKTLNEHTDVVMLNYYPQDQQFEVHPPITVHNDFVSINSHFLYRDIWLTEVGYQSGSEFCASSEDQQAAFYHELFTAWDTHKDFFRYLMVDWLNDVSNEQLAQWEEYYGNSDPAFLEYLGTLGLRTHDGQEKNAWLQLKVEAGSRGWVEVFPATK